MTEEGTYDPQYDEYERTCLPLSCSELQMVGNHSPFCPSPEQSPQTPFCGAPHSPPSPVTNTHVLFIKTHRRTVHVPTKTSQVFFLFDNTSLLLTPTLKRALTGLWSLVCSSMWLRYLSCFILLPLHRILSHQAGTRHFPLQETVTVSEVKLRVRHTQYCWLCVSVTIRPENASSQAKCNQDYKERN